MGGIQPACCNTAIYQNTVLYVIIKSMKTITLGATGITVPQNAFGALPVQRVGVADAVEILRRAYDGGMTFLILPDLIRIVKLRWG